MGHQPLRKQLEHRVLALVARDAQRYYVARGIVEQSVHAHRYAPPVELQRRAMTHVPMPERARALCLPAQPPSRDQLAHARHGRAGEAGG
jgi:hypothetical protein